jgi:hypothetical protein
VSEFREGLARMPLPRLVKAIASQIVHEAGLLLDESRWSVARAARLRGGGRSVWLLARSLGRCGCSV